MEHRRGYSPTPPLQPLLLLLLLTALVAGRTQNFDLFLDSDDVEPLIGFAGRLYYVRDGHMQANALTYVMHVPPFVNTLNLTWSAKGGGDLYYAIDVHADGDSVVPKLIAAREGTMPGAQAVLALSMPCALDTGAADVRLTIRTSVNRSAASVTVVAIVFQKSCADRPLRAGDRVPTSVLSETDLPLLYVKEYFYYMICFASWMVAMVVICCLFTYRRDSARDLMIIKGFQRGNEMNAYLKSAALNRSSGNSNRFNNRKSLGPGSGRAKTKDLHECVAELGVHRQRVRLQNVELEGTFGRVYRGVYAMADGRDEEVFVKTVTDQASAVQISVLLHEGLSMYGLSHKNILTIRAVCVEPQHVEPFLLFPYNNNKNLKRFLLNCKTSESISCTLTTREIIDMTLQIVNGMQYLHKNRHLHKDVAARNCLINQELKIQIADNALSRDLFPNDYHCLGDNKNRPIKWMAIESLERKKFSTASDIWSFGVLLWELLTLCQQPYADIDPFEMSAYLQDGFRLTQPVNCPDELFTVMACCWALAPNERPTFSQISVFTNEFNNQLVKFV